MESLQNPSTSTRAINLEFFAGYGGYGYGVLFAIDPINKTIVIVELNSRWWEDYCEAGQDRGDPCIPEPPNPEDIESFYISYVSAVRVFSKLTPVLMENLKSIPRKAYDAWMLPPEEFFKIKGSEIIGQKLYTKLYKKYIKMKEIF